MKKILKNNHLTVSIRILFTLLIGISLIQAEKKRAFLELISTESCPYCVTATGFLNEWKKPGSPSYLGHDMARNWIVIHYHDDDHISNLMDNENSQENPVEYRFNSGNGYPYNDALAWYPWLVLDGEYITLSLWDDLIDYAEGMREEDTPVGLSLEGTVFNELDANIKLTITSEKDLSGKDLRLFVAATIDSVSHTNEYEVSQDMHQDLFLEWIGTTGEGSQCGEGCEDGQPITLTKDETVVKTFTWSIDQQPEANEDPNVNPVSWDEKNVKIVAFVQDFATAEIMQSAMIARTGGVHTGIENEIPLPSKLSLNQNYPNPFNPTTLISYDLPEQNVVRLAVYDILGKRVRSLVNQKMDAGAHTSFWDGTDDSGEIVGGGVYFYTLQTNDFIQTRKMLFIK
ncbi:MAG: T9SS type A sorting domain-containing protein [Candidatus Neomarinimicrobiota bacterium]